MYQDDIVAEASFSADELENAFPLDVGRRFKDEAGLALRDRVLAAMDSMEERQRARPAKAEQRRRDTVEALLSNLTAAYLNSYDPEQYVGVSFNRNDYSHTDLDCDVMRACRAHLFEEGLIEFAPGFLKRDAHGGGSFGRTSRLRPSQRLRHLIDELAIGRRSLTIARSQIIRIKQAVKGLSAAPADVEASRDLLIAINARLGATDLRLHPAVEAIADSRGMEDEGEDQDARERKRCYAGDRTAKALYRAFKHDWEHGGRIYGGWWMSEKRIWRPYLQIDGQPCVELDYKTLHPRLLYRRVETEMPDDPYLIGGTGTQAMRDLGKRTFNRLLNRAERDPTKRLRMKAARGDPRILPKGTPYKVYLNSLVHHLSDIEQWFGSGEGIRLQRQDSDLAIQVLSRMEDKGIVTLPIHDSFVVAKDQEVHLRNAMEEAYHDLFGGFPAISRKVPRSWSLSSARQVHN